MPAIVRSIPRWIALGTITLLFSVTLKPIVAQAIELRNFEREFDVVIDAGVSLKGTLTQSLELERVGRWLFRAEINVWGVKATEVSIFSELSNDQLVPIFYRLTVPFSDNIDKEFSGRTVGFDRLNVLLQFERDFASNIERRVWKYKVLNYDQPYSIQFRSHQSIALGNGAVARSKVFEVIHGSRRQLRTRFWMDIDRKRMVQIEHLEDSYSYKAVAKS